MQQRDRYDDVSATTNMEGANMKEIEIEIKGNEVEINWQRDYLQATWWPLAQTLHGYVDIHSHYAQTQDERR